jgi:hypothetical protein
MAHSFRSDRLSEKVNLVLPTKEYLLQTRQLAVLQPENSWKRHAPALVVNLSGAEISPRLSTDLRHTTHATYVGTYADQYLFGFHHLHALIGPGGEFNCQELDYYAARLQRHVANPPPPSYAIPTIQESGGHYTVDFARLEARDVVAISEPVFFGSPIEPANWGMWLLHGLPSAFAFVAAGQPGRFLCYAPDAWQQNLLAFVGVHPDRLLQQAPWATYRCAQIALHQYSSVDLVVDSLAHTILQAICARCRVAASLPPSRKLYISRRSITKASGGNYRALRNEDRLIAALESRGYEVLEPETLSFKEQVLRFSQASAVVGLGGAGMFNTVFCAPHTKVVSIEGTDTFALNHARFFASLNLEYGFIIGAEDLNGGNRPHNPWTLDVERAVKAIDSFI